MKIFSVCVMYRILKIQILPSFLMRLIFFNRYIFVSYTFTLPLFAEPFVFQFAIQKFKDQDI